MADRPILITIIAVLAVILGLLSLVGGIVLLKEEAVAAWVAIIIGLFMIIVGYALWNGWTIAWYLGLILFAINIIMGVYRAILKDYSGVLSIIIAIIVIWYLFQPKVKTFFKV